MPPPLPRNLIPMSAHFVSQRTLSSFPCTIPNVPLQRMFTSNPRSGKVRKRTHNFRVERGERTLRRLNRLDLPNHCVFYDTDRPRDSQIQYANKFFAPSKHSPIHIWCSSTFRMIPESGIPEVAFMGRSNVGKSSLVNMLLGSDICYTSPKPGRTRVMNSFGIGGLKMGDSKIALVDTPGYGKGSQLQWGEEMTKYLNRRKQLRRVFLLIDSKVGIKKLDGIMLELLRNYAIPHQVIMTKADNILLQGSLGVHRGLTARKQAMFLAAIRRTEEQMVPRPPAQGHPPLRDILSVSSKIKSNLADSNLGIDALRWAILQATGFDELRRSGTQV